MFEMIRVLIVFVLLMGSVSASSVSCMIVDKKVLIDIDLDVGSTFILPEEYSSLEKHGSHINFISEDFLRKDNEWIFVLPKIIDSVYDLEVYLPKNHVLVDDLVYPKGYKISSDGKNIILNWDEIDDEAIVFYEGVKNSYFWFWLVFCILVFLVICFFVYEKKRFCKELDRLKKEAKIKNKEIKKNIVCKNLFGDEKNIVEFLVKRNNCWMKELVRELGLSKVRMSRKIRSLCEKGIVEKESFGRESRIRLVKK